MGRGRNRRHKATRRNAAKLKKKKDGKHPKAIKRPFRKAKPRKEIRRQNQMSLLSKSDHIRLGLPATFLVDKKYAGFIEQVKGMYNAGKINDLIFLAIGKWNSRTRRRLHGILKENGNGWAWNHLMFKFPREFEAQFILRMAKNLELTHFVGMDREQVKTLYMANGLHSVRIFYWDDERASSKEFFEWIVKYHPQYYILYDQGDDAEAVINTGHAMVWTDYGLSDPL